MGRDGLDERDVWWVGVDIGPEVGAALRSAAGPLMEEMQADFRSAGALLRRLLAVELRRVAAAAGLTWTDRDSLLCGLRFDGLGIPTAIPEGDG